MPYEATVFNLMIASPSDVNLEREIIKEIIHEWNGMHSEKTKIILMPLGWDTHSAPVTGSRGQEIINTQILIRSDLLIAVFWNRIGTPTSEAVSGTAEEIQEHVAKGKPAMIYFSNTPVRQDSVNDAQYKSLQEFKKWCLEHGLIETYDDQQDFKDKFRRQLATLINRDESFIGDRRIGTPSIIRGGTFGPATSSAASLSPEAHHLLREAALSGNGVVGKILHLEGAIVQSNGKNFVEPNNPRSRAAWEDAINQLLTLGYLTPIGNKGHTYQISKDGYKAADSLTQST